MPFCTNCGTKLADDAKFCSSCGTPTAPGMNTGTETPPGQSPKPSVFEKLLQSEDKTAEFDPADIAANKWIAVLSYLGPLVFIPLYAKKKSPYAQFHAKEGIMMFILWCLYSMVSNILSMIKVPTFRYETIFGVKVPTAEIVHTPWIIWVLISLIGLAVTAFAVLGIVYALMGKAKELPLIGKLKFYN